MNQQFGGHRQMGSKS